MLKATKRILIPRRSHGHWFWLQILLSCVLIGGAGSLAHSLVFAQTTFSCQPTSQARAVNETAAFSVQNPGRDIYNWIAEFGSPASGNGLNFSTTYSSPGTYSVGVYNSAKQFSYCSVQVTAPTVNYQTSWLGGDNPPIINNTLTPGQIYTINLQIQNTGNANSGPVSLLVENPSNTYIVDSGIGPPPPGGSANYGPCAAFSAASCWKWGLTSLAAGQSFAASFSFKVAANTPANTPLPFTAYALTSSGSQQGTSTRNFTAGASSSSLRPYFTSDGSVHAGARFGSEPCLETGTDTVQGQSGNSRSDLAVSAAGRITNFGSGGTASGTNLTFGNQNPADLGYYGQVCRPDLYQNYDNLTLNSSTTLSMSQIPAGLSRYSNLTLTGGTVPRDFNATIVVDGTLTITGNIDYTTAGYTSKADIPSFGVIAADNISIAPNVSRIYGIYYACSAGRTGRINTCQSTGSYPNPVITSNAGACNTPLTVNGALIATSIYFRRTATASAAEIVNYLPQLMLNPPVGLSQVAEQL